MKRQLERVEMYIEDGRRTPISSPAATGPDT